MHTVTNIVVAGLGGQGVLRATDVLADTALRSGFDVKKSEIKGMSQRGGSVIGDVRFGDRVFSPMVPLGEADFLLILESSEVEPNRHLLRVSGTLITPESVPVSRLSHKKTLNVALLGVLSAHLPFAEDEWLASLQAGFEPKHFAMNKQAFLLGRSGEKAAMPVETMALQH
jgi:indolepyruvate ferredoxin oxidoreductase, beta subunit